MSTQVQYNLYVGSKQDLLHCTMDIVSCTNIPKFKPRHLVLNMVDASDKKYFHLEQFNVVPGWINPLVPTLIHCDQGLSRAPSMALYYLAFMGAISSSSYYRAYSDFKQLYPLFAPNTGIREFMSEWWTALMDD